jgi:D-lactate dehydrogenase (cytochrome)
VVKDFPDYLRDESNVTADAVEGIFFPRTASQAAWAVEQARKRGMPVTVSGGRTGICAGAVPPGGFLISLERMDRVLLLRSGHRGLELTLESGVRLCDLADMLRRRDPGVEREAGAVEELARSRTGYLYPPDPTETTATIGGTVATNASGARTFYYGPTREYVTGLEAVLPTGELLRLRRGDIREQEGRFTVRREQGRPLVIPAPTYRMPATKHAAGFYSAPGMDLIDLFIGSEGVLGIVTRVTVRLVQAPPAVMGAVAFFEDEGRCLSFVERARKEPERPLALEYFDRASLDLLRGAREDQGSASEIPEIPESGGGVYFEFVYDGEPALRERVERWSETAGPGRAADPWGALTRRDIDRMKAFRHTLPETVNQIIAGRRRADHRIHKVGTDMAVPGDRLGEMVGCYRDALGRDGLEHVIFGHVGDGHLHVNMLPSTYRELQRARELYRLFARKAVDLGGTVSAEHGIGRIKREYLPVLYDRDALEQMRGIKHALDPEGLLNPGVLL